ncbi:4096_t:CDS:1, partial [Ambispora leptoticha]
YMTETNQLSVNKFANHNEVSTHQQPQAVDKKLIKITGTLTSPIQLKGENTKEPYYYSFIRLKGQSTDLPVIFKIKGRPVDKMIMTNNDKYCLNCSAVANYPNRLSHAFYCQYNKESKEKPEEDS